MLHQEIAKMTEKSEKRKQKLKSVCPTRWAQSHEAVGTYLELQPAVIESLEEIKTWKDACQIMESVNSIVLPLNRELQSKNQDLGEATKLADDALNEFMYKREHANSNFQVVYENVAKICSEHEITMKLPRRCNQQKNRCNVQTQSIEDYYRISFFVPFLDTFISQLKSRFSEHKSIFQSFGQMFLKQEFNEKKCADLYTFYEDALDCSKSNFLSEVKMWRQRIQGLNIQNALDALLVSVFRSEIYMSKSL